MQKQIKTLFIILFIASSCNSQQNTMKKFEWRPTANAPKYYAAEIIDGNFYMEDGSSIYIPKGHTLMTGWGKTGAAHIVGDDFKPVPYKFDIKWVSYLEEKFYGGTFELPKKKLTQLFEEGYINSQNKKEFPDSIVIGLAPGGVIVVWLYGSFTTEIARYQASEIKMTIEEFKPYATRTLDDYLKVIKSNIIEEDIKGAIDVNNIPFGLWDTYRKKYIWAPKINFKADGNPKLKTILVNSYNGEFFNTYGENPFITKMVERAIPSKIVMNWNDSNGNGYGAKVFFNEEEIFKVFDAVYKQEKRNEGILILEVDKYNSNIKVFLESDIERIELKKTIIKVYETSR